MTNKDPIQIVARTALPLVGDPEITDEQIHLSQPEKQHFQQTIKMSSEACLLSLNITEI